MNSTKAPKVTVILPVYNGERTIKAAVESMLSQTFADFELIVCIDGTNDRSEDIIRSIDDPRVRVIKNPVNLGLGRTLNRLIAEAHPQSQYIAMAEQDDWYYPDRLQAQVDFLDHYSQYGLVTGIVEHWDGKAVTASLPSMLVRGEQFPVDYKECFLLLYRELNMLPQTCMMFRKNTFVDHGLYFSAHYPSMPTDWDFALRFCKFAPVYGLHQPLVRQGREPNRVSLSKNLKQTFSSGFELLRSFRYECPKVVSDKDYKYAVVNLKIRELSNLPFLRRWGSLLRLFFATGHSLAFDRLKLETQRLFNGYYARGVT